MARIPDANKNHMKDTCLLSTLNWNFVVHTVIMYGNYDILKFAVDTIIIYVKFITCNSRCRSKLTPSMILMSGSINEIKFGHLVCMTMRAHSGCTRSMTGSVTLTWPS
jgi:hypothetical protein